MNDRAAERSFSLEGDVVFVTGAVRGIGGAIVRRFVADGARVGFTYRASDRNERFAEELVASVADPSRVIPLVADAADPDQTAVAVDRLMNHFGKPVDVAIANAANTGKLPWQDITYDQWDEMMATNLRGAFIVAKCVADGMREQGYGKIITVGSVMALTGDPRSLHYVSTKAGLVGFTRSLARAEGRNGIRVNCVIPGAIIVESELERGADPEKTLAWMQQVQCLMYRGQPDDLAAACHFLASHASDFMTGQVVTVDGGWAHY